MAILSVGGGKQYATIQSAVAASSAGDTVLVDAGTYTNDFVSISHSLTIMSVGGTAALVATTSPPNGKGIIDAGGSGVEVTLQGLDISGSAVPDANGAAVRYEGGTLHLIGDSIHGNQNGLLANGDPNGVITIDGSLFTGNGTGTGSTHNIYVGGIASLSVTNSVITAANIGHDIKSRAAATTIVGNVIADGAGGNSSYEIDLPNGGVGIIMGNIIQKGVNADNPAAIAFGEEGGLYGTSSLTVSGNTMFNDYTAHGATAVWNAAGAPATISGNAMYGWRSTVTGPAAMTNNMSLSAEPALAALSAATAGGVVGYTDTDAGQSGYVSLVSPGAGGPSYLQGMYIWSGSDNVAISTGKPNVFLKGGAGSDALQVSSGQNVLDGGSGSNFLVGGSGTDTFFTDARGGAVVWSTLVNFHAGDAATLWGFNPGTSTFSWDSGISGATGFEGATLRAHIDGSPMVTASITFAGLSVDQAQSLNVMTGTAGGASYLYLTA